MHLAYLHNELSNYLHGLHAFVTGTISGECYRFKIFESYVRLFRHVVSPGYIFMVDNADFPEQVRSTTP